MENMSNAIWERLRFFRAFISVALQVILVSWAALGIGLLVQEQVLPHPYCDYRLFDLHWYEWAIAFLLLLCVSALEALYQ